MIDWTKADHTNDDIIDKIADRAVKIFGGDKINFLMDLHAVEIGGCLMDMQKLLDADDFNFAHDVAGINQNLDHETGEL